MNVILKHTLNRMYYDYFDVVMIPTANVKFVFDDFSKKKKIVRKIVLLTRIELGDLRTRHVFLMNEVGKAKYFSIFK